MLASIGLIALAMLIAPPLARRMDQRAGWVLAFDAAGNMALRDAAQAAGLLQAIAHATAKAGMFMAAGLVYAALGHDRIDDLAGAARALPVAVLAFLVGGVALMGVLPSGAYLAKKLLLASADASGQWWWTLVLQGGAAFTAAYVVLIAVRVLRRPVVAPLSGLKPVSMLSQCAALGLALASLALSVREIQLSGDALNLHLKDLEDQ